MPFIGFLGNIYGPFAETLEIRTKLKDLLSKLQIKILKIT